PAREACRQLRARPQRAQSGGDPRNVAPDGRPHPTCPRIRARLRAAALRSCAGEEAPRRGGLSQRLRRRRPHAISTVLRAGRGPLPAPGPRARPEEARGDAAPDPADHARPGTARADLRAGVPVGRRPARRGGLRRLDQGLFLLCALRGSEAQATVMVWRAVVWRRALAIGAAPPATGTSATTATA